MKDAAQVFEGKVLWVKKEGVIKNMSEVRVKVVKQIKGEVHAKKVSVFVKCLSTICCGYDFKKGKKYRIATYKGIRYYYTSMCMEETHPIKEYSD